MGTIQTRARDLLRKSVEILAQEQGAQTLDDLGNLILSAYSWHGSGSAKGGDAGVVKIEKVVVGPQTEQGTRITAYAEHFGWQEDPFIRLQRPKTYPGPYAVLLCEQIPAPIADEVLNSVTKNQDNLDRYQVLKAVLQPAVTSFCGGMFFGVDEEHHASLWVQPYESIHGLNPMYQLRQVHAGEWYRAVGFGHGAQDAAKQIVDLVKKGRFEATDDSLWPLPESYFKVPEISEGSRATEEIKRALNRPAA